MLISVFLTAIIMESPSDVMKAMRALSVRWNKDPHEVIFEWFKQAVLPAIRNPVYTWNICPQDGHEKYTVTFVVQISPRPEFLRRIDGADDKICQASTCYDPFNGWEICNVWAGEDSVELTFWGEATSDRVGLLDAFKVTP